MPWRCHPSGGIGHNFCEMKLGTGRRRDVNALLHQQTITAGRGMWKHELGLTLQLVPKDGKASNVRLALRYTSALMSNCRLSASDLTYATGANGPKKNSCTVLMPIPKSEPIGQVAVGIPLSKSPKSCKASL